MVTCLHRLEAVGKSKGKLDDVEQHLYNLYSIPSLRERMQSLNNHIQAERPKMQATLMKQCVQPCSGVFCSPSPVLKQCSLCVCLAAVAAVAVAAVVVKRLQIGSCSVLKQPPFSLEWGRLSNA